MKKFIFVFFLFLSSSYATPVPEKLEDAKLEIMDLYLTNRREKALALCDESLKKWPNNPDLLYHKAKILSMFGKKKEAIKCLDIAIEANDHPPGIVFFKKGQIVELFGQLEEALKNYKLAIEHGHDDRWVEFAIAGVELKLFEEKKGKK
jgi:tetratricopeptide (TPR) repeat protein